MPKPNREQEYDRLEEQFAAVRAAKMAAEATMDWLERVEVELMYAPPDGSPEQTEPAPVEPAAECEFLSGGRCAVLSEVVDGVPLCPWTREHRSKCRILELATKRRPDDAPCSTCAGTGHAADPDLGEAECPECTEPAPDQEPEDDECPWLTCDDFQRCRALMNPAGEGYMGCLSFASGFQNGTDCPVAKLAAERDDAAQRAEEAREDGINEAMRITGEAINTTARTAMASVDELREQKSEAETAMHAALDERAGLLVDVDEANERITELEAELARLKALPVVPVPSGMDLVEVVTGLRRRAADNEQRGYTLSAAAQRRHADALESAAPLDDLAVINKTTAAIASGACDILAKHDPAPDGVYATAAAALSSAVGDDEPTSSDARKARLFVRGPLPSPPAGYSSWETYLTTWGVHGLCAASLIAWLAGETEGGNPDV